MLVGTYRFYKIRWVSGLLGQKKMDDLGLYYHYIIIGLIALMAWPHPFGGSDPPSLDRTPLPPISARFLTCQPSPRRTSISEN
jgi:hypothetical protein